MPRRKNTVDGVTYDPVDDYEENGSEVRTLEEHLAAEARFDQVDQIPDYHETNPTLDTSGPEFDPEFVQSLREKAVGRDVQKAAKEAAQEIEGE